MQEEAPSRLRAMIDGRCPACRKGEMFVYRFPHPTRFLETHEHCPHCGIRYEAEPGFFWGAMYVNYAFNVATLTIVGLLIYFLFNPESPWIYVGAVVLVIIGTIPITTRISRVVMLHLFGPYSFRQELFEGKKQAS